MQKLTTENFNKARDYLLKNGRPLEQALFHYHFEGGPVTAVWRELAAYQNAEGGFGQALEPDLRSPSSSGLATGIALRILAKTGSPSKSSLVKGAVDYLLRSLDPLALTWRVAPLDANDHPHAPWWHDQDGSLAKTFDDYQIIPRAELVAYLHRYADLVPADWLDDVTRAAVAAAEELPLGGGGGDDLVYAIRLSQAGGLLEDERERLLNRVRDVAATAVTRDPEQWETYSIPPLKLASSPDSPVADLFPDDIQHNLDYLIETQTDEGYWEPTWTWGDFYPDVWPMARDEWRGEIILRNLLSLRDYGRLALPK